MRNRLQGRLIKGVAAQGFGQLISLVMQITGVPVYLHYWGTVRYGEWLLLSSVLGYLSISDLSFGTAAQTEMIIRVARGDREGALAVLQSVWLLVTGLSVSLMLLAIGAVWLMPLERWLHLTRLPHSNVVGIVALLIAQVTLAQQGAFLAAGFQCDGNFAVGVVASNCLRLAEFLAGILTVAIGGNFAHLALVVLLTRVMGYFTLYRMIRRRSPWLIPGFKHARFALVKPLIGPALSYNAFPLGSALSLQGILTVVGIHFGPAAVTVFSTSRTLTRIVVQIMNAIANAVSIELSVALGAGNVALARMLHRRTGQITLWAALVASLFLTLAGAPIYRLWMHGKVAFDAGLFHLLLFVVVLSSVSTASTAVPMAINRHQRIAAVYLIATMLAVGLAVVFVRIWGLNGAAIALFVEEGFMILYVVQHSLQLLDDTVIGYTGMVLIPPVAWLWSRIKAQRRGAEAPP